VTVDGLVATIGQKVDPDTAQVEVDGILLPVKPGLVYYLVFKEQDRISTADDPQGRPTVVDLVPPEPRVYPVGRLDADSEGLIVLTNDGELTHRLTHPSFGVTKTYIARVAGSPGDGVIKELESGIELEDGPARAISARVIDTQGGEALIEVVMGEGRKREVRRMFDAVGYPVARLVRVAIGPLQDRMLRPGSWRELTPAEVRSLYAASARLEL
jgi:23S rRNA pseudouridine2605 synthase